MQQFVTVTTDKFYGKAASHKYLLICRITRTRKTKGKRALSYQALKRPAAKVTSGRIGPSHHPPTLGHIVS